MAGFSLQLIAVLLLLGALIAFLADFLGLYLGKRRISVGRLRPRHTARLIAVLAGMLITGVTVTISAALIPQVRDAFLRLEGLRREARVLQAENRELLAAVQSARQQASRAREEGRRAQAEREKALASAQEAETGLAVARRELTATRAKFEERRARLAKTEQQLQQVRQGYETARTRLAQAQTEVEAAEKNVERARRTVQSYSEEVTRLTTERERVRAEVTALQSSLADMMALVQAIGEGEVIYKVSDEIARTVVPRGQTKAEVLAALTALLQQAEAAAREKGAVPGPEGTVLVPFALGLEPVTFAQVFDTLAQEIAGAELETVVQAYARVNAYKGAQVVADFRAFRNRLILRRGEALAHRTLDAFLSDRQLAAAVLALLQEARDRARDLGLMPGPGGQFLDVPVDEVVEVILQIRRMWGSVSVSLVAASETWTAGPLLTKFVVQPA